MSGASITTCPVCGNTDTRVERHGLYDDRYGYPGRFNLRLCPACHHRFLDARFEPVELERLYTEFYPRRQLDISKWQPAPEIGALRSWVGRERSAAFRWVPPRVRVLDVGCGFGESVGYHQRRGCDAEGIDADANLQRVADGHGLNVRVGLFRAADYPADHFDYVTLDQVIEHVVEPLTLLRDAAAVLRPGGKLIVATPNGRSWMARRLRSRWVHFHTPYHLQLFSETSLVTAAQRVGLRVCGVRYITNPKWYGFQWMHLLSRPVKPGRSSPFWVAGQAWPRGLVPLRKLIAGLGRAGLNHGVGAVLDLLRAGDNLVAILERPGE